MALAVYTTRFALELALLAVFAWWGWARSGGGVVGVVLGAAVAAGAAGTWGALVAPKASHRLADPPRLVVEVLLFALGAAALWVAWDAAAAVLLFVASVTVAVLTRVVADPFAASGAK